MKKFRVPDDVSAICFDIDNTLYRNERYALSQAELLLDRLGQEKGWDRSRVDLELAQVKEITKKEQSQGNWFRMLGIPIAVSVEWREALLHPEEFLAVDPQLDRALSNLGRFTLCALTNNPSSIGMRTLRSLGISERFSFIVGLDDTGFSKPSPEPFAEVERRLAIPAEEIVIVGDRFDVDLAVPLERGWGGVLVESMADVYALPDLFPG